MSFDIERARRETPACREILHFNNAGASLMPQPVVEAVTGHIELEARIGGYEAADQERETLERVYGALASLLGCTAGEIAFVENATRAWDMAFYSIRLKPGDRILTAVSEYASNYIAFLQAARKTGAEIEVIPNDEQGQISIPALRKAVERKTKLIAISHVPTNGGLVNPAEEVGKIAREAGVLYLLDACQSVGQMPVNVEAIGCDLLSGTGRKYLRGPRGTGFLYARLNVIEQLEPPFLDMHAAEWVTQDRYEIRSDARRFENWEMNYAGKAGLGVAVEYALGWGMTAIEARIQLLAAALREQLSEIPGVRVQDLGAKRCGIVSFTYAGCDPDRLKASLRERKINMSVSPRSSTLIDMNARGLENVARASVHYFNTEEEIVRFCAALRDAAEL